MPGSKTQIATARHVVATAAIGRYVRLAGVGVKTTYGWRRTGGGWGADDDDEGKDEANLDKTARKPIEICRSSVR